ncbi:Single-strand binding protein family protein [Sinosporangium album]|uniref:Single-strand binding protein family protein n=1 Tax=Sinosporangium album TaxID=504805 RepID=A0A1G7WFK4_9ACTN|nr:Single-strand binding protein family protein [Sinosporangium album]
MDRNEVILVGRLSARPERKSLHAEDSLVTWRVIVRRQRRQPSTRVDSIRCVTYDRQVASGLDDCGPGDVIEVIGSLRRRFLADRNTYMEVEATAVRNLPPPLPAEELGPAAATPRSVDALMAAVPSTAAALSTTAGVSTTAGGNASTVEEASAAAPASATASASTAARVFAAEKGKGGVMSDALMLPPSLLGDRSERAAASPERGGDGSMWGSGRRLKGRSPEGRVLLGMSGGGPGPLSSAGKARGGGGGSAGPSGRTEGRGGGPVRPGAGREGAHAIRERADAARGGPDGETELMHRCPASCGSAPNSLMRGGGRGGGSAPVCDQAVGGPLPGERSKAAVCADRCDAMSLGPCGRDGCGSCGRSRTLPPALDGGESDLGGRADGGPATGHSESGARVSGRRSTAMPGEAGGRPVADSGVLAVGGAAAADGPSGEGASSPSVAGGPPGGGRARAAQVPRPKATPPDGRVGEDGGAEPVPSLDRGLPPLCPSGREDGNAEKGTRSRRLGGLINLWRRCA